MKFTEGQQVEVIDCVNGHEFANGEIVTILEVNAYESEYWASNKNGKKWWITDEEVGEPKDNTRSLLQSILDNAVHIGGTDYRISEDVINKIREVLK